MTESKSSRPSEGNHFNIDETLSWKNPKDKLGSANLLKKFEDLVASEIPEATCPGTPPEYGTVEFHIQAFERWY